MIGFFVKNLVTNLKQKFKNVFLRVVILYDKNSKNLPKKSKFFQIL